MIGILLHSLLNKNPDFSYKTAEKVRGQLTSRVDPKDYYDPELMFSIIMSESKAAEVDPLLVVSVISVESGFRPSAVSRVGAIGMMQLMPKTFEEMMGGRPGNIWNPYLNVEAGIKYLGLLRSQFRDVKTTLVAYNAGPHVAHLCRVRGFFPQRFLSYPQMVQKKRFFLLRKKTLDQSSDEEMIQAIAEF